ncbi:MAG: hypothetical protein A2Y16_03155 [Tenericutes bacterium GWF2_57_13]|nr:MAG: hypothetical protein A2Y16_03155 [Tenericutes bacterium GWF2_57_13]
MIRDENVLWLRLLRSRITDPVTTYEAYDQLFQMMSPVPTDYWITPGTAPFLQHRAVFDDTAYNFRLRAKRAIVKGRFQKNGIGYVRFDELPLFAAIYKKEPDHMGPLEWKFYDLLNHEGPMTIGMIKELTGMYVKDITPVLHKLQSAFIVFEDQKDNDWERSWYLIENEFPEVDLQQWTMDSALRTAFVRFLMMNVFADAGMARSFYNIPAKRAEEVFLALVEDGIAVPALFDGRSGYVMKSDLELLEGSEQKIKRSVYAINRNDFLVRSNEHLLKNAPGTAASGTMYHLLIDGKFQGTVEGGFKFGPHIVENVRVDLPEAEALARKVEILDAVAVVLDPELSAPKRYNGVERT